MTELIERLLRWRLAQARNGGTAGHHARVASACNGPLAWWETCPEQFQTLWTRLGKIQVVYGHAMVESSARAGGYPVPTLIVRAAEKPKWKRRSACSISVSGELDDVAPVSSRRKPQGNPTQLLS